MRLFTGNIEWKEPRDVVGAMVGESLTINCGAVGEPQPEIEVRSLFMIMLIID